MKKFRKNKFLKLAALGGLAALLIFAPATASAGWFDIVPSPSELVVKIFQVIAFIFNFIGGILFTLAGMFVNLMLSLNLDILTDKNTIVHVGWQLVRDIANLGFVLVIIVIAFATILRFEQYGVTKLLPKLIAAAIIVNFSFAIAAAFINFTHVLTNFFAERALSSSTLGPWDLSTSLSNAFGPQRFFIDSGDTPPGAEEADGAAGGLSSAILISLTGIIFTVIFTLIAAFVLLAFALMLFLRYLYLTFLVILSPVIWLFWVIPALKGQFGKWWSSFLKWSFFAPAMMFFIYLALISIELVGNIGIELKDTGGYFTGVLQNIMIQGAQMVVLSGILIGGLIIAQKMSITGSAGAMKLAGVAGKAGQAWVGRQALRAGSAPFRTAAGQKAVAGLQKFGTGTGGGRGARFARAVGKFTGVNAFTRTVGNTLSDVGIVQGEGLVKDAEKRQAGLSDDQLAIRVAGMNDFERIAALSRLAKVKKLDKVPEIDSYIADKDTSAMFKKFGKEGNYKDIEKARGANTAMLNAEGEAQMATAAAEFYKTFSPKDFAKVQFGDIFAKFNNEKPQFGKSEEDHGAFQKAVAYGMAVNNPGDVRKIFVDVKSSDLETAGDAVASTINRVDPALGTKIQGVLERTLFQRGRGELFDSVPPPAGAAPGTTTT